MIITRPVTIRAAPGQAVELVWDSREPYQATVEVDAGAAPGAGLDAPGAVVLQGLRIKHSSPSIANNYAVRLAVSVVAWSAVLGGLPVTPVPAMHTGLPCSNFLLVLLLLLHARLARACPQGCGAALVDCDITSSTGDGVGIEGGAPRLQGCIVHDCARHGALGFLFVFFLFWRMRCVGLLWGPLVPRTQPTLTLTLTPRPAPSPAAAQAWRCLATCWAAAARQNSTAWPLVIIR